jgi:cytochrome c
LPVDPRPGRRSWDAQRSAANSRDLRGKVLRIHPLPEGGYAIPEGNLFPDGADGAPEIYCLGLRNPFRLSVDDATGMLYVADVGPNVLPELGVTPAGYEELHATTTAANLGWPYFVGPNEPLPLYDFDAMREIARQRPESPRNDSPNNTGRRELPPAQPALVWYDNLPSERFPSAGSGGRSLLAGPVYRHDPDNPSPVKLPEAFDGRLFLADWMRNWIQTVRLGGDGPELEPFQPAWDFRRPVDLKFGDDGALYLIEYGDQWWENRDSRIVRVVYRRGNRVPRAALAASGTAGPEPLSLTFDAAASTDPDGDPLAFAWTVDGQPVPETAPRLAHTFTARGGHEVTVTATDSHGATATARQVVHAGNGRPQVAFSAPLHGSFFDWDRPIPYSVDVAEADGDAVDLSLVSVEGEFRSRPHGEDGDVVDPGLALMRSSTCFACHQAATPSAGPPYRAVALKYRDDPDARERLSAKILAGGAGAWGPLPMPPHPQHGLDEARQMVGWVLSLADPAGTLPLAGPAGSYPAPPRPSAGARVDEGVLILTAAYTDDGKGGTLPRLRGEQALVLHSRRKKAAFADASDGMARVEQVEGEKGIIGHFPDGAHAVWRELRLDGVRSVTLRAGGLGARGGRFELRRGAPDGPLLATVDVAATGEAPFSEVPVPFPTGTGLADLCVVARGAAPDTVLGLNWIEFRDQAPTP